MDETDSREELIIDYIKGKHVLDLGPGDTTFRSLHHFLRENARSVVGVELDPIRAKKLKKHGFSVVVGNAEKIDMKKTYDVVVAGDLIEHVDNPGVFIENSMRHLKKGGYFIFNTPNCYSINLLLRGLFLGRVRVLDEHVSGFTEQLLRELLRRKNIIPKNIIYFTHKNKTVPSRVIRFFGFLNKEWHENILIVIQKK